MSIRICAVICEYDPFHNGHRHHLQAARERTGADYIICLMSGCILQRGTFARYDKFLRARSALLHGADLVLELPVRTSCGPASDFASGAIYIAQCLGPVTHLSFGCEPELIPLLPKAAQELAQNTPAFADCLHQKLSTGLSYPAACAQALSEILCSPELAAMLNAPNALLALEYLRHLPQGIEPVPIPRIGSYHGEELTPFASASAIRTAAQTGQLSLARDAIPEFELYLAAENQRDVHEPDALSQALLSTIRGMEPQALSQIYGMAEGLHNRFADCARTAVDRDSLIASVKTKRFTYARLSRICSAALLGLTDSLAEQTSKPEYARILGFRSSAQPLLRILRQQSSLPLAALAREMPRDCAQYTLDRRAQDLWSLGCSNKEQRTCGRDLINGPIIL